jgi:hypothetical protein
MGSTPSSILRRGYVARDDVGSRFVDVHHPRRAQSA